MLNSKKLRFYSEELELISSALKLSVSNEIEDIPFELKLSYNILAAETIKKLSNRETGIDIDHYEVMGMALLNLYSVIEETGAIPIEIADSSDTTQYLSIISNILDKLEEISNAHDRTLFPDD